MPHFLGEFELSPRLFDPSMVDYVIKYYIYIYPCLVLIAEKRHE
jgi:hypothetical protein